MLRSFYASTLILLAAAFSCSVTTSPYDIYVSPNGLHSNDGSIHSPIGNLHQAIEMSRNLKKDRVVNIWLSDGTHRISEPLTLGLLIVF